MVNQNHMLQAALDYAAKGFPVFPLIIGGKRPAGDLAPNGCKDASTDEDQICEWWTAKPDANIGVVTDGLCVVDIDGADHAWLSDNGRLDALAGSPVSQTPRGGRHYVFRQNGEPLRNTAGRLADHVDTRADGGYIVAAPSVVDGKPYKWLPGHELDSRDELPTVPEWIIQGLQVVNEIPLTLEDEKIHKGIQHNTLFKYGCKMRRWGLSFNEINAALQVMNLQRCDEPGTESAIEDIARSAARYTPDRGAMAEIEEFEPEPLKEFNWLSAAELNASDCTLEYHIDHILAKGQPGLMAGGQKTCKTNTASDLAISLATGTRFLDRFKVNERCNVAFFSCESGEPVLKDNNTRVAKSKGIDPGSIENLFYCFDVPSLDSKSDLEQIQQFIEEREIDVLIIDPFYLTANLGNDAGNLFVVGEKLKPLTKLGQDTGCTVVLIHHTRKNTGQKDNAEPRMEDIAYSGVPQWMRQWILIGRREAYDGDQPGSHKLWFTAGGSAGHSAAFGLNIEEGSQNDPQGRRWEVDVIPAEEARAQTRSAQEQQKDRTKDAKLKGYIKRVTDFLRQSGPNTKTKIKEGTGLTHSNIEQALFAMVSDGIVEQCRVMASNNQEYDGYKFSSSFGNSLVKTTDTLDTITHTQNTRKGGCMSVCESEGEIVYDETESSELFDELNDIFPPD
ncbi:AAA family ATPase [Gimesia benthica]|uniref:AAA family ATPase n=1 Tax=Gimesia benthica TaxID=2608982 RepID=A0A6I6A533_9PLAN|nr:bifunctional DNA primase/polymerase [Gimesia benthica]QGQ21206.1 AAA family ATPase [Gimesia benthica]